MNSDETKKMCRQTEKGKLYFDSPEDYGQHRWTVDTPEDYHMMQLLFEKMEHPESSGWMEVLDIIKKNPDIESINASSTAKDVKIVDSRS